MVTTAVGDDGPQGVRRPEPGEGGERALVDALRAALAPERVVVEPLGRALFSRDASVLTGEPGPVCFPLDAAEVQAVVRIARAHDRAIVPRGSGTGLAGGAVPVSDGHPPVVVVTTKMDRILSVDVEQRVAWVEPGVLNLDLSRAVSEHGLHFAPDPSSQQSCSIGGNVANNSGGPHCLAYGVTSAHVLAVEVVLADGERTLLGGLDPDPAGYDLRGVFVGSEGTLGVATAVAVRLTENPPAVRTLLADFTTVEDAATTVSGIIAAGIVPAALEMMDAEITRAVEDYVGAGFPRDAAAILLVEVDGLPDGVEAAAAAVIAVATANGARTVRVAADETERALLWKGRKSAFGAIARIAPNYYLHDAVVPRTRLVEVMTKVYEIAARHDLRMMNVFHAGDGNLHPLIVFDRRVEGTMERVMRAGDEILRACVDAGGMLSGEHGIGIEKRDHMPLVFSALDLDVQARIRDAFDPDGVCNPLKVLPAGARCGDLQSVPEGAWV